MSRAHDVGPPPIRLWTLPYLAWQTAVADRTRYRRQRPVSFRDLLGSIRPRLRDPVFILGAPRSGTTFLGGCVGRLPGMSYHFEPPATKAAARHVYSQEWRPWKARAYYRGVYRWLLRIHAAGRERFAEKTPRNCFLVDFLARTFPDAGFILILRDGRDAAVSLREKPWLRRAGTNSGRREPGGYRYGAEPRFWVEPDRRDEFVRTTDLHRAVWSWRRHNEAALEGMAGLAADRTLILRYEEIPSDPDGTADRVVAFLGAQDPEAREVARRAFGEARPHRIGRWKATLTETELAIVEAEAGGLLDRLGYHNLSPRGEPSG